jgi:hypothetical protein
LILCVAEPVHQLSVSSGLFDRIQIGALNILYYRNLQNIGVAKVANNSRHFVKLRELRRAPPPLAGNNLIVALMPGIGPQYEGLDDPSGPDRLCQFIQQFLLEPSARLIGVWTDLCDGYDCFGLGCRTVIWQWGIGPDIGHKRGKSATQAPFVFSISHFLRPI